ncbi:MAG: hypothetical protein GXO07_06315 [Crenarchaeota archaeon]|nr:hypothetical protein [Thermoproteota archaeon]
MDYKESTRLLEELLGAKVSIDGSAARLYKDGIELEAPVLAAKALALFMKPEKAWAALEALYGPNPREAYRRYSEIPGRACWLTKAVARAIARRLAGAGADRLEEELARRWPNVCGDVNAVSEALKLVTRMNELGMSASFKQGEGGGHVITPYGELRIRKSDPEDARFLRELRELLEEDRDLFRRTLSALLSSEGCGGLAEAVSLSEALHKYGFIRARLRERAKELAARAMRTVKSGEW